MASQWPPKKNTAFTLDFTLYKNDGTIVADPGTYTKKVSIDGGDVADIAANVTEENTTYGQLSLVIASGEMNGDRIWIYITDNTAGTVPFTATLLTSAYTLDEIGADLAAVHVHAGAADVTVNHADHGNAKLVRSTTPANTLTVDASHRALSDLASILGTALTETAGQIAAAFKKFFDKATPTGTINSLPDAVAGANGGLTTSNGTVQTQTVTLVAGQSIACSDKTGFSLSATGADLILKSSTFVQAIVAAINEFATYGLMALNALLVTTGIKAASIPAATLAASQHVIVDSGTITTLTGHTPQTGDVFAKLPANIEHLSITDTTGLVDITQTAADKVWGASARVLTANTNLSIPSAADVKTAMEADGSKLDHLWEMTEDDAGVRKLTTNALEQAPTGGSAPSAADIANAVWNEAIADHTTSTTFGGKNQKVVPSETINDYKATGFAVAGDKMDLIDAPNATGISAIVTAISNLATYGLTALNTLLVSTGIKAASVPNVTLANGAHGGAATVITLQTPIEANVASETNHDFTALQKTSLNAATPAVTVSDKTGFSGTVTDKTGFSLSSAGIKAIWDFLTADVTAAIASFANLFKTNVDGKISETSKPGTAQTITPPADMALNSTVAKEAILNLKIPTALSFTGANVNAESKVTAAPSDMAKDSTVAKDGTVMKAANYTAPPTVDQIHDEVVEGSLTFRKIMKILLSFAAGKSTGGGTETITFRDNADSKARITATADTDGNRTTVTLDGD